MATLLSTQHNLRRQNVMVGSTGYVPLENKNERENKHIRVVKGVGMGHFGTIGGEREKGSHLGFWRVVIGGEGE